MSTLPINDMQVVTASTPTLAKPFNSARTWAHLVGLTSALTPRLQLVDSSSVAKTAGALMPFHAERDKVLKVSR